MSLLGIDIGTSAVKGVLIDDRGRGLARARRGYRVVVPAPGRAELSPTRVWAATRGVIATLAGIGEAERSPVRAVCVGGSGDEVVAVDRQGRPVAPVVMAADRRAEPEGEALSASVAPDALYARTGLWDIPASPLARFGWLRRHEPERASRVVRLLSWPEWTATRLGLPPVVDPTLAARTLGYDVPGGGYATFLPGLPIDLLSEVVPTGTSLGGLAGPAAERMGLRRGTQFVVGGFDQAMATLGAGAVEAGMAHDGNGSWEALSVRQPGPSIDPRLRPARCSTGPSVTDPARLEIMASWPGGMALRWVVGLASGGRASDRVIARTLSGLPSDDPRAVAVPDITGPSGPLGGAAAIAGLSLGMAHGDLVLAVLAGLAHRLRVATLTVSSTGVPISSIRATGGGARSDRWLQLKADATGLPVERPAELEAGAFAAAILAGAAVGVLPRVEEAVQELVEVDRRFEPRVNATARSAREALRYDALADAVAKLVAS